MLKKKHIDTICIGVIIAALVVTVLFANGERLGLEKAAAVPGYERSLFEKNRVHTIDIVMNDWEGFIEKALEENYRPANIVIDGKEIKNVGIRVKGNNSKQLTAKYGLERYSLKVEIDHYEYKDYYGLDKFSLDSSFQDNTYMKTWIAFDMMRHMGVPAPLCSYTWVRVNGEDKGLYLAVEEPEEAFARRNFGNHYGKLYKPEYKRLEDDNSDVALIYTDDDFESYDNIFRTAKFKTSRQDKERVIDALRVLSTGINLEEAVDVDEVLRYFTAQVFVVNLDSYLGKTGHNYFLYEKDGRLSILPWDYNLAFSTYSLGMPGAINDARLYVNYPIDTPASGDVMMKRPLYHNVMKNNEYFAKYHEYFDYLIESYFESGYFEKMVAETTEMIGPYVEKDPTAFCSYEDFLKGAKTIKNFCILRAKSIRGQLDGTIPSTIKGQSEPGAAFVDVGDLWVPDMGEIADLKD